MITSKIKNFIHYPISYIVFHLNPVVLFIYKTIITPFLIRRIRNKNKITVAFVISELGSWKTENLYLKMLSNQRFRVKLLLTRDLSAPYAFNILKSYLDKNKFDYTEITKGDKIRTRFKPDIIFYQKPYNAIIDISLFYQYNLTSLFCFVSYTFWNRCSPKINKVDFLPYAWQIFIENPTVYTDLERVMHNHARNMVVTGVPMMDILMKDKKAFQNPWKANNKKRIIYAPHHTISTESYKSQSPFDYSTFLLYADYILELAQKYRQITQWAFKPHPLLRTKLYKVWGTERTDAYFNKWHKLDNAIVSEGEYLGLFKHSDAMIHDCGSFKIEYLSTGNPAMYLMKDEQEYDYPNTQTQEAIELHYKAYNKQDIEAFVINVIDGKDELRHSRVEYKSKYLTPPYSKYACDNIINAILGIEEYTN